MMVEGNIIEKSLLPILNYQSELFAVMVDLPQLSTGFLKLVGINIFKYCKFQNSEKILTRQAEKNEGDQKEQAAKLRQQSLAICSNYFDLMAYQLNDKLNERKRENLLKFISEVSFKMTACSIRVLCSNKEEPKIAKLKRVNKRTKVFRLMGFQIALDSIIIQSIFYKKDIKPVAKRLGKINKGKTQRWAAKDAFARIDQLYGSYFDGKHLINMNPLQFQKERVQNWENNIHNPLMFSKFFGLRKIFKTTQWNIDQEIKAFRSNHLFNFNYERDFVPSYLSESIHKKPHNSHFVKSEYLSSFDDESSEKNESFSPYEAIHSKYYHPGSFNPSPHFKFPCDDDSKLFEMKKTDKIKNIYRINGDKTRKASRFSRKSKDFNFSPVGVFFKANSLCYRKYKKYRIKNSKDETLRIFNHFLTIKGCKLLVSQWLKPIFTYVFEEPFKNMRERRARNREIMKKQSERRLNIQRRSHLVDASFETEEDAQEHHQHHDHGLLFTEDISNKVTKSFTLGIKVEKPEFNINDYENNCQILFASDKECFITFSQEFLEYDLFEQDYKKTVKCGFSDLQLFTVPPNINTENKIFWLEDTLTQPFKTDSTSSNLTETELSQENSYENTSGEEELDRSVFDNFLDADPKKLERETQKVMSRRGYSVQGSIRSRQENRSVSSSRRNLKMNFKTQRRSKSKVDHVLRSSRASYTKLKKIDLDPKKIDIKSNLAEPQKKKNIFLSAQKEKANSQKKRRNSFEKLPKKESYVHNFIRKGILNRIIYCEKATFRYISYKNSKCIIDFSKPITPENILFMENNEGRQVIWNGRFRTNKFIANIGTFTSIMSSQDFEIFFIMNSFLMSMFGQGSEQRKENLDMRYKRMLEELKNIGEDGLMTYIQEKIKEKDINKKKMMLDNSKKTNFEYVFDKIQLLMTEGEKEFLKLIIRKCHGKHVFSSTGQNDITFGIKDIEIDNVMVKSGEHDKVLQRLTNHRHNQNQAILLNQSYYTVPGVNPMNRWKVVSNYEIMITPLRVDITKDIYEKLSNYIFRKETERLQKKIDEDLETQKLYVQNPELYFRIREMTLKKHKELYLKEQQEGKKDLAKKNTTIQIPPTYYKRVRLGEMRLVVTFRANSLLMVSAQILKLNPNLSRVAKG